MIVILMSAASIEAAYGCDLFSTESRYIKPFLEESAMILAPADCRDVEGI